jgi:hypothetical protein
MKPIHLLSLLLAGWLGSVATTKAAQQISGSNVFDDGKKSKPAETNNYARLLRWHRYSYPVNSSYPYLQQLPPWEKIPMLLQWINSDRSDGSLPVAHSQLVALSRSDFGQPKSPPEGGMAKDRLNYHEAKCNEAWKHWWETVGAAYPDRIRTQGRQNPRAWKLVTREKVQPLPETRISIPGEWVLRTSFRGGDYGGHQTEAMTLRRTSDSATLIRGLRKSTRGLLEWEEWQPLTVEQADDFAFAIAYAVDNPWLLKPKAPTGPGADSRFLEGRTLTLYYPRFHFNYADLQGNIWWNDNPSHWEGGERTEDNFLEPGFAIGAVGLLMWRTFPEEPAANAAGSFPGSWKPVKMPNMTILRQLQDDLEIRGDFVEALWNADRLSNALEALADFGTAEQLPAIKQLEAELPVRLEKVSAVVDQDPNGKHSKWQVQQLLVAAEKARAAITAARR